MTEPGIEQENSAKNTYKIAKDGIKNSTSWNEIKAAGKVAVEASSTTYARNSRFSLFVDNDYKTPDEFDSLVAQNKPLYEMTVQPGEEYIIQGKERNAYVPGADFTSAFASKFSDSGPDDQFVPSGVTIELGLGDFKEGTLTSSAITDAGNKQGISLKITESEVAFGLYRDGVLQNQKKLTEDDWDINPFELEDFNYNIEKFAVKRIEGNLYGSGSQKLFMKLRDVDDGKEEYIKVAEVGDDFEAAIDEFNLFNSIRVDLEGTADPFGFSVGPLQYFNESDVEIPVRRKRSTKRGLSVSSTFGDATGTVVSVYRKNPNNSEVPIDIRCGAKAQTDGRLEIREIHPDYVSFDSVDQTLDSNWGPPALLRQRETGLQELDMVPGDVTLTSSNGLSEGEQGATTEYDGQSTRGGFSAATESEDSERVSEYNYYVATVRHSDTSVDLSRFDLFSEEQW